MKYGMTRPADLQIRRSRNVEPDVDLDPRFHLDSVAVAGARVNRSAHPKRVLGIDLKRIVRPVIHAKVSRVVSIREEAMRLVVKRSQTEVKGMLGGSKGFSFTLAYQVQLTPEEQEIVRKYKLGTYPVTFKTIQGNSIADDTIDSMTMGTSQTVSSVETLLRNEEVIKDACDKLPVLFDVISSFGGSEVIDYPRHR